MNTRQKIAISYHPGVMLQEKLEELGMPIKTFAVRCGKPESTIHAVLNKTSSVTSEMAILFESVLGIPAHMWLRMQARYDEYVARCQRERELEESYYWCKKFPFATMVAKRYISVKGNLTVAEKTEVLLDFFGFAKSSSWEAYYQKQILGAEFRLSLNGVSDPYSLSAWLRHGELEAMRQQEIVAFNMDTLKEYLPKILELANQGRSDCLSVLKRFCNEVGMVLVYSPGLPNTKANGATRWIKDKPLVQISDYHKQYDIFWFSFFHELGHILLHGKRDIFIEGIDYPQRDAKKEKEADDFAAECLVPAKAEKRLHQMTYNQENLKEFCRQEGIHPAFVVGRMHHLGLLDYQYGNKNIPQIDFEYKS